MTNNLAKIRAVLNLHYPRFAEQQEALAALAELEWAAKDLVAKFESPEITDDACESAYFRACAISDEAGGNSIEIGDGDAGEARIWLSAWQLELGPTLGLVTREEMASRVEAAFKSGLERFAPFYRSDAEVHSAWLESDARKQLDAK